MNAELVTARHLARKAVIYIRQSSPHQVLTNQESLRLQYALRQRACELGWHEADIEVIDADLGLSGAAAEHRRGFKELIARVTLGEVGIVLSSEVTRLARNCSDWYPLLDLCGYRACLIADRDGVYDPGSLNGRLLLGLKGTISEVELHLLRGRLTAGLLSKAARGELALALPAGLVRDADGRVTKDPDREVQDRIALVFTTFLEQGSVARVMKSFKQPPAHRAAARPLRRGSLAGADHRHARRHPQEPGLCRGLRLRPNPVLPPALRQRQAGHHPLPEERMEDRGAGQVPGLPRLGQLRADPGDAARQPCRVRAEQDTRGAARRRGPAAGHRLVRAVRPQDGRAVQGRQPLRLQPPACHPRRAGVPAPAGRPDRRGGGGRVLRGGDPGRAGGLGAGP